MKTLLVRDRIAAEIKRRISSDFYGPRGIIPPERDLAREFSTSRTTISKALNELRGLGLISQARRRGTRVIPLHQRPTAGAVGILAAGGTLPKAEPAHIIQAMEDTLLRCKQHFELALDFENPATVTADVITRRFAGALFVEGLGFEPLFPELDKRHFIYVVANLEKNIDATCTWVDHRKTTQTAVRMLAALGHRRIALLVRPPELFFYGKALAGYRDALDQAGLPFKEELLIVSENPDSLGAYLRVKEYLGQHPVPTGIIAARGYLAQGARQALAEEGLKIGRDVSLIGYDDFSWPEGRKFLTTFRQPTREIGTVAAEMLMERLISGWRPLEKREIAVPLVLRKSVGPCQTDSPDGSELDVTLVAQSEQSR